MTKKSEVSDLFEDFRTRHNLPVRFVWRIRWEILSKSWVTARSLQSHTSWLESQSYLGCAGRPLGVQVFHDKLEYGLGTCF